MAIAWALWIGAGPLALAGPVIHEIHFHPGRGLHELEFVELYNNGPDVTELSYWSLTGGVRFKFPEGTRLERHGFLVLAADPEALERRWGVKALGPWEGKLSNDGEELVLRDAAGKKRDAVDYGIGFPWPCASAGSGASLELIDPRLDNNLAGSWRASIPPDVSSREPLILVPAQSPNWYYRPGVREASQPLDRWREAGFELDRSWKKGRAPFGYSDGDDNTVLGDMRNRYTTVFIRRSFTVPTGQVPTALLLRVYSDDGAMVWINGTLVARLRAPSDEPRFDSQATVNHEAAWEERLLEECERFLKAGDNIIAVQGFNGSLSSSDFSLDVEFRTPRSDTLPARPSPGMGNTAAVNNAPPQIRQVNHDPPVARSGRPLSITAKITDPDGVADVRLQYQLVPPGGYIRKEDAAYQTEWETVPMKDDGQQSDRAKGDSDYTARLEPSQFGHRWLIRYRILARDSKGASVLAPYADDLQPNFAAFCYDGVPPWKGADQPGVTDPKTFSREFMNAIRVVHLIATEDDVNNSQYAYAYNERYVRGTLVIDSRVYDHIRFRNRGETTTYMTGKNKWRFRFNRTHKLETTVDYGEPGRKLHWNRMNLNPGTMPYRPEMRGSAALNERLTFRLYQLAGCPAPDTGYIQFRVIDHADEAGADQYSGDLWGLYMRFNAIDGAFLDDAGLPDGPIYKIAQSGPYLAREPVHASPAGKGLEDFWPNADSRETSETWWREKVNLDHYYSYHAISIAAAQYDQKINHNYYLYPHADAGWMPFPWDTDLSVQPQSYHEGDYRWQTRLKYALRHPRLRLEYQNRARELLDLLLQRDQMEKIVDELAKPLRNVDNESFAELDRFVWNYHPSARGSHRGSYFQNPVRGGNQWETSIHFESNDIEGRIAYFKDFFSPAPAASVRAYRGWAVRLLARDAHDPLIPERPVVSGDPFDMLAFRCSPFCSPQRNAIPSGLHWRIADVTGPADYEIDAVWETVTGVEQREMHVPAHLLEPGRVYRVRARIGDDTGRLSHWSLPVEFTGPPHPVQAYRDALRLTEIMYHPAPASSEAEIMAADEPSDFEFIELTHRGETPLNLEPLRFSEGITFRFATTGPEVMNPGDRKVIVRSRRAFLARYPDAAAAILGEWEDGKLANDGERIALGYGETSPVVRISYDDKKPWPAKADGDGFSVELKDLAGPQKDGAAHWRASGERHGSPGR